MPYIVDPLKNVPEREGKEVLNEESDDAMMFSSPTSQSPHKEKEWPSLKHSKSMTQLQTMEMLRDTFEVSKDLLHVQSPRFRQAAVKRTYEQAFKPDDQQKRSQYFLVENMEIEHATRTETQLQKRPHIEETDPIEYKLNFNPSNKVKAYQEVTSKTEVILKSSKADYLRQEMFSNLESKEEVESAFDVKFLGPGSSLQVEKIKEHQNEVEELSNKMYMLTENMQFSESSHGGQVNSDRGGEVDIDAVMQTLGDQMAKNPEDDDEEVSGSLDDLDVDEAIMDDGGSLN